MDQINTINENLKKPVIGFDAFTGNDYVSSFFQKGKMMCWKTMKKNQNFVDALNRLGENWSIDTSDTVIAILEKYTCVMYCYPREKLVNTVRIKLFEKKYTKEGKFIDISVLPPCNSVLIFYIKRANYVIT